ncbi:MAG: polyphosphate kinase 2 [Weeksellaceae bacterium]
MSKKEITKEELEILNSKEGLRALLLEEKINPKKALKNVKYENRIEELQEELLIMQQWVVDNKKKVVILFEGRDAAGKGGAIRKTVEHLPPREVRTVALPKPDEVEEGKWYFQRYINQLPQEGEIVFFDRSWYNRAIVEPVNGFCTQAQYQTFMDQVNEMEKMMTQSGLILIKMYFSITKKEQERRLKDIIDNPVKRWKFSKVDERALALWDDYTRYKEAMFKETQKYVPWKVINANKKNTARIEAIEYILDQIPYEGKDKEKIKHKKIF